MGIATAFALGLAPAVVVWGTVFLVWPEIGRARYVRRVTEIRDDAEDAILFGHLPRNEATQRFIRKADAILEDPRALSFSLLWAISRSHQDLGGALRPKPITYADLTPSQRATMHALDERMVDALTIYLVQGSRFYLPFHWVAAVVGGSGSVFRRVRGATRAATAPPRQLAKEFNRIQDPRPFTHV